jgi:hypothetical protein
MKIQIVLLTLVALCLFNTSALADNHTVSGAFDGTEPFMGAAPNSCNTAAKRYRVAGTITVSTSGAYRVVDAGNWFPFYLQAGGIADSVVMIYAGNFNSASPATNRVASVDEYEDVQLNSGTNYTLVVQHWCEEYNGAYAVVIEGGPGTVSGDGFTSPAETIGNFDAGSPSAYFSDIDATLRYQANEKTVSETSQFFFVDLWEETDGTPLLLRVYKDSFDPQNTDTNLVYNSQGDFIGSFYLQSGVNYVFVMVEAEADSQHLQYVLYPSASPSAAIFNPGLNGSWTSPGIKAQGILVDVVASAGVVFFAHFTFQDDVVTAATKGGNPALQSSGGGDSSVQATIGADDQIWFTAFGLIPESSSMMDIKYENSTGGRFNAETPQATTDSDYGSGYIEAIACDHLVVNWNLPGGVTDTRDYYKAAQDTVPYCLGFVPAGPVSAAW